MAVIWGSSNRDVLRGTSSNDVVWGLDGADSFHWRGGLGNDVFHAGNGSEHYDTNPYTPGNPGGDRLYLEGPEGARIVFETTASGTVEIGKNTLNFTGVERVFGTDGNDIVRAGGAGLNANTGGMPHHGITISTGAGHDRIVGSRFDDIIDGGSGNDTIWGGAGNDFIQSSTGHDKIYGGLGNENIRWGNGDNAHNPGNDTIWGGAGNDLINIWIKDGDITPSTQAQGIRGATVTITQIRADGSFDGRAVSDVGGAATLRFREFELGWTHAGNDRVSAAGVAAGPDGAGIHFNTRWGHDQLTGSNGNDILEADAGRDTVRGGAGNDQIWIGNGRDGDGDRDVLIFRRGDGRDVVFGFEADRDVIDAGGRGYSVRETGQGTELNFGNGDTVLLSDVFDFG